MTTIDARAAGDLALMLGDPRRAIRAMAIPILVALAVVQINQFADTFWVSGLGVQATTAVTAMVPVYGLMMCAGIGIGAGATATIAYRLGRNEYADANRLAANSLVLGLMISAITSAIVAISMDLLISMMGAGEVRWQCIQYVLPFVLMSPALLMNSILGGILRAEGAARKSMAVQMSAALLNIVLDPLMIYTMGMGVFGAGLSTAVSALIAFGIGLAWYLRGRTVVKLERKHLKPDCGSMREVLDVGGPKTVESLISNASDLIQRVFLVIAGGTTAMILYNYPWRYIGLANLPASAVSTAMVPVCSSAYGQGDPEKASAGFSYTVKAALATSVALSVMLLIFAGPLMDILTTEESMRPLRAQLVWTMQVSVLLIPFSALMGIGSSMLQSMKRSKVSMRFMMLWGFLKLGSYAVACMHSFEAIIFCMVAMHVFGGITLMALAKREGSKIVRS
jgi:putative MATE family efflux protein